MKSAEKKHPLLSIQPHDIILPPLFISSTYILYIYPNAVYSTVSTFTGQYMYFYHDIYSPLTCFKINVVIYLHKALFTFII